MATYYVSPTGNNAFTGGISDPFFEVWKGVSVLTPGDTLLIRAGTYPESLESGIPSGTSWSAKVRIAAYPGETVWLKPTSGVNNRVLEFQFNEKYIEFDGINLDGETTLYDTIKINSTSVGQNAHHIRIMNAEILGTLNVTRPGSYPASNVILITNFDLSYLGGNELINLVVHRAAGTAPTSDYAHGIYNESPDTLIDGCEVYDVPGTGVQLYSGHAGSVDRCTIRNCVFHDLNRSSTFDQRAITVSGDDNLVYNNVSYTVHPASGQGAFYLFTGNNNKVFNNTVYDTLNSSIGIHVSSLMTNTQIKNNISYLNGGADYVNDAGGSTTALTNLFSTDPLFTNASAGNFTLQSGSSAIGAGTTLSEVATDINGVARGATTDIGAYEFAISAPGIYTDTFTGSAADLSAPWRQWRDSTPMVLTGAGKAGVSFDGNNCGAIYTSPVGADQYSQIVPQFNGPGDGSQYLYLLVRASDVVDNYNGGSGYWFWSDGGSDTQVMVYESGGGSLVVLVQDDSFTFASGDILKFSVVGTELNIYKNGAVVPSLNVSDATLSGGLPGFGGYGTTGVCQFDSWQGGDVTAASSDMSAFMYHYRLRRAA